MTDICGDDRFEVIAEAKKDLLESTNIEMTPDEMSVIDNILFRCWQMGWLRQYETFEFCDGENPCKEYDQEKHCCHRWTKVIRQTVEEMKAEPEQKKGEWIKEDLSGYLTPGGNSIYHCSECGHTEGPWPHPRLTNFCPSCGTNMRGEDEKA